MVSASASNSGVYGACHGDAAAARIGPGSTAQTAKSYQSTSTGGTFEGEQFDRAAEFEGAQPVVGQRDNEMFFHGVILTQNG